MLRSADGKMRIDFGNTSMITDPSAQKTFVLDHLKKEALTVPMPQAPQLTPPALPAGALPSHAIPPQVEELGRALIEGHEVEGKKYTFQPPPLPKPPAAPQLPAMPKLPGMPNAPQAPPMPPPPPIPTIAEIWTSTKTKMPVLTKISGPFGQQVCHCKVSAGAEPPPTAFQVPPNYTHVPMLSPPKPPKPPSVTPPSLKAPSLPR